MNVRRLAVIGVMIVGAACESGRSGRRSGAPVVRDSAGVSIVDNSEVDVAGLPRWGVDTTPALIIGATTGDSAYEFASIGDVHQLPNGMIVVLSGRGEAAFEFRFFDATGRHIVTHGRYGQGPGEYQWVNFFGSVGGDTLIGVDFPNSRLDWLSASKGYLRSSRLDPNGFKKLLGDDAYGMVETMVPLGDSVYAVKAYRRMPQAATPAQRSQSYHIVDLGAGTTLDLGQYDDAPVKVVALSTGGNNYMSSPSAGVPVHVVDRARGRICVALTSVTEISCIDRSGKRSRIRWRDAVVPYTSDDNRAAVAAMRARLEDPRSRMTPQDREALLAAREVPKRHPPIAAFELDTEGNFWIDGRQVALADSFPTGNIRVDQAIHIGNTSVLRVIETPDGAPAVGVFRIRKPD
jgi:hypothetical protein